MARSDHQGSSPKTVGTDTVFARARPRDCRASSSLSAPWTSAWSARVCPRNARPAATFGDHVGLLGRNERRGRGSGPEEHLRGHPEGPWLVIPIGGSQ